MPIFALSDELIFPDPKLAEDGLLAVGGDLSAERLILAYKMGIFPWYNPGDPILWWSPDPRFVLFPDELKVSKSMRPYFNQKKYRVSFDQEFERVISHCAEVDRKGQNEPGTWITSDMALKEEVCTRVFFSSCSYATAALELPLWWCHGIQ